MAKLNFENKNKINYGFQEQKTETEVKNYPPNAVVKIPIDQIDPGENIRKTELDETLEELGNSIKQYGQLEPVIVYRKDNKYVIKMGSRRYRASLLVGLETLDCVVENDFKSEQERIIIQALENEQRLDMSPRDRERYLVQLIESGMKEVEVAKALHKTKGWVSEALKAHNIYKENKEIIDSFSEEPNTRDLWTASKLSPEALQEVLNKAKDNGGTKKDFKTELNKALDKGTVKKEAKKESGENTVEAKFNSQELNFSANIKLNSDMKLATVKSSGEDADLNAFIKRQIENYYLNKGYQVD